MGLITNHADTAKLPPPDNLIIRLCSLLRDSLREKGIVVNCRISSSAGKIGWTRDMLRCLVMECGGEAARLTDVAEWYCKHIGDKYVPVARSAGSFRSKFYAIEDAMKRDRARNPTATITEAAKAVAHRASAVGWSASVKSLLPLHAQVCMDGYTAARKKLAGFLNGKMSDGSALYRAALRLDSMLPDPQEYAKQYLEQFVHNRVKWEKWNGDASPLLWVKDCSHFVEKCKRILTDYGTPKLWAEIEGLL